MTKRITDRPLLPPGPAPKEPPPMAAKAIYACAAGGFSVVGVAQALGTSKDTLGRWFDEYPELKEAFDQGREQERYMLHNKLYRLAMEQDNATAAFFLLKARHGYREGDQGDTANRVSINFTLPGALPMEQFAAIDVTPQPEGLPATTTKKGSTP